jgi:dihydroorotate dehydrogenase
MSLLKLSTLATKLMTMLPSEASHSLALNSLKLIDALGVNLVTKKPLNSYKCLGIEFKNRLGLAGGLDKNGDYINCLSALGFSFLELGTATPIPQLGNQKPRLYRDKPKEALINNMGFNNKGIDYLIKNISKANKFCPIAVSIGKNSNTPLDKAIDDYLICFEKAYVCSDFITVNISSPNTQNLRELGSKNYLPELIQSLKNKQSTLSTDHGYKPLIVKLSPDIEDNELDIFISTIIKGGIDGLIATNTSSFHNHFHKPSGISGKPLFELSTKILKKVKGLVGQDFTIIASGGVMDTETFSKKIDSGADLVQIYTGLIYKGPQLIQDILALKD